MASTILGTRVCISTTSVKQRMVGLWKSSSINKKKKVTRQQLCSSTVFHQFSMKTTHPPPRGCSKPAFLSAGERQTPSDASTENMSTIIFQKRYFRCMCPPEIGDKSCPNTILLPSAVIMRVFSAMQYYYCTTNTKSVQHRVAVLFQHNTAPPLPLQFEVESCWYPRFTGRTKPRK